MLSPSGFLTRKYGLVVTGEKAPPTTANANVYGLAPSVASIPTNNHDSTS